MGTYLLPDCDTQQVMDTWQHWYQQQREPKVLVKVKVAPTDVKNPKRVLFSVQLSFPKPWRIFCIIAVLVLLAGLEGTLLILPSKADVISSAAASSSQASLLANLLTLLLCFSGLTPFFILNSQGSELRRTEYSLQNFFKKEGIEIFPLTPSCSWILFPRDALIIQGGIIVLLCTQLFFWLGLSPFLPLLLPYLLIVMVLVLVILLREYVYQKIVVTQQKHSYWKLEVTRLARQATYFFLFPLLFYGMIFLLKTISFLLPLRQKTASEVTSNLILTTVGYPNLQAWEQSTHLIANQFFQQIISGTSVIVTLLLLLSFLFVWMSKPTSIAIWKNLEIHPLEAGPGRVAQEKSSFLVNAVITVDWFLIVIIHITGALVVALGMLWPYISDGHLIAILGNWTIPFLWYQEALKVLWGDVPGNVFSCIVVFLMFSSAWLWLSMWVYSLGEAVWRLLVLTFSPAVRDKNITELVPDLCQQLGIASPLIRIDNDSREGPRTTAILPFARFCVIRLPASFITTLNRDERRAVLAHELAHAKKHARKIWLAKQLSRIAIFGSGYLTLQLNYGEMELEADKMAVSITRDPNSLKDAIEKIGFAMLLDSQTDSGEDPQLKGLAKVFSELYQWYFSDNLWGAFHPEGERIDYLKSLSNATKDILDISGQAASHPRRYSSRKKWLAAGVVIIGCVVLLFHNVLFPVPKSAPPAIPGCLAAGTVRPAVISPFAQGNHQNIVYTENEGTSQAPTLSILKRYDLTTHLMTEIIRLPKTQISNVQISADRQWILFNSRVAGQSKLQLVRVDGQKLQTIYCLESEMSPSEFSSLSFSWSPDLQWVVIPPSSPLRTIINIINIRDGTIRTLNLHDTELFTPLTWRDGTHLFMHGGSLQSHHSIDKIYTLDISHPQEATLTYLPGTELQGDWMETSFLISQDHKTLFTNTYIFGQGIQVGPGSITMQSLTGGDHKTIYANQHFAIVQLQVIANTLLFVMANGDSNPGSSHDLDTSQNGLWKINIDGSGLTRLTTTGKDDQFGLADVSNDGNRYGLVIGTSNTSALAFNSLHGNTPTVFASATGNTTLSFVGWITV